MVHMLRLQSAVEFLFTYSWALLIIGILAVFILFFVSVSRAVVPTGCSFTSGLGCAGMSIGSNALGTRINIVATNGQDYTLDNPFVVIGTAYGTASAFCAPTNVVQGGSMLCTVSLNNQIKTGTHVYGNMSMSMSTCLSGTPINCQRSEQLTSIGNFSEYVGGYTGGIPVSVALYAPQSQTHVGTPVRITANVRMFGQSARGLEVIFTSNTDSDVISPFVVVTDAYGNATAFLMPGVAGDVEITANVIDITSSNTVHVET